MPPKATDHTNILGLCRQHTYNIWLLTISDLKSIVWPETAFGLFSALSGSQMTTNTSPSLREILLRLPQVVLWNWLNVFIFDLANQRLEDSIVEDRVNKPWRPIPSGRLTALDATNLLLLSIPTIIFITWYLGGMEECIIMIVLTWMYNDLGGADHHYITRNVINAFGFVCYSSGSTKVAAGYWKWDLSQQGLVWLSLIWVIIFSTLQVQDMADVEGDAARGRKTLPLVQGQLIGRLSIAIPVLIFSAICPWFWQLAEWGYVLPIGVGMIIAFRTFTYRDAESDIKTFKLWCAWTMVLYLLPLFKDYSVFEGSLLA